MTRQIRITRSDIRGSTPSEIRTVLRPVGNWHFLHALDIVQKGDLYRCLPDDESECDDAIFITGWSPIHDGSSLIGKAYHEVDSQLEIIRPVSEQGTSYPIYDIDEETEDA